MREIPQEDLPPDKRDWLDRPKDKCIDWSTLAFLIGVLIMIAVIWFTIITPKLMDAGLK
jgi:hypothetical protein